MVKFMRLLPEFSFHPLNGLALLFPLILARFGIMLALNPNALRRADVTPPVENEARWAMPVYMLSEFLLVAYPFFLTIKGTAVWLLVGVPLMAAGLALVALSALAFAHNQGQLSDGVYRVSHNPMYVGYFLYFVGIGLVTASWLYLLLAAVEQIALYWIIRAEERWCLAEYGEAYRHYSQTVPRYLGRRAL